MLKYKDLNSTTNLNPVPFLICPACSERFSAEKDDYFWAIPNKIIKCHWCDEPLQRMVERKLLINT